MTSTNKQNALLFLNTVFGTKYEEHFALIWNKANKQSSWFDSIEIAANFAAEQAKKPGHDLYVGTGLIKQKPVEDAHKKRIKNDEVSAIGGFWLDVDVKHELHKKQNLPETYEEAIELIKSFEIEPTFIINSGHGLQAWWCFDEVWNFASDDERAEAYNLSKRLQYFFKAEAVKRNWDVDSTHDLARIFRIPGTINYKAEPKAVEILEQADTLPIDMLKNAILALPEFEVVETANKSKSSIKSTPALSQSDFPTDFKAVSERVLDAIKLDAFLSLDPKIKKTYEHKRTDLQDQSCSSYDFALVNYAVNYGWSNQECVDLMITHRKKYGAGLKLNAIDNYYGRTLFNARNKNKINKSESFDNNEPKIENGRLVIVASDQNLERITKQAWRALISANEPPSLFRFGDAPCRIEMSDDGSPILRELNLARTKHELARAAQWIKFKGKFQERIDASPPNDVVADVLATKNMPLPVLDRLTTTPVYGRDGILQSEVGYNARSRIYYHKTDDLIIPAVSLQPTNEDVKQARSFIDEMLCDFPFVSHSDKAHAIGLLMLPFVREMIDGATPLHAIESPSPGSGKGLLTNCLAIPSVLNPTQITESQNDEEFRKKLTSALRNSPSFLVIDNAKQRIKSGEFASLLTATVWTDRIMGASEIVNLPVRCAFVLTANNPTYSQEIMRRTVRIRIDPKVERAWLREGFRHSDLRSWAIENRRNLIWSALTLIQSWIAAGKLLFAGKKLGSYERWSEVIGGILANAEINGFLENSFEFYEQADTEGDIWRELIEDWWFLYGSKPVRTEDIRLLQTSSELYDERASTEHSQRIIIGKQLAAARDRRFGDFKIERAGERRRAAFWRLVWIGEGEAPETNVTDDFEVKSVSVVQHTHTH